MISSFIDLHGILTANILSFPKALTAIAITTAATAAMAVVAGMDLANSYVAYNDAKITLERKEKDGTATQADRDALTAATVGLAVSAVFAAVTICVPINIGDAVIDGIAMAGSKLGSTAATNLLAKQIARIEIFEIK